MNYKRKLKLITTFIFDVDGVLTDGMVTLLNNGDQIRHMNIKDGYAIKYAISKNYKIAIISGGINKGVEKRLAKLGITDLYMGCVNKTEILKKIVSFYNLKKEEILYMGDDIPDLNIMKQVGLPTCPKDAAIDIKQISEYVSPNLGGTGCVRDVIEQTLRVQNKWEI